MNAAASFPNPGQPGRAGVKNRNKRKREKEEGEGVRAERSKKEEKRTEEEMLRFNKRTQVEAMHFFV